MSASRKLSRHLRDALGPEASEDLVTIVDEIRADRAEFRKQMRADLGEFRAQMRGDFAEFTREIRTEMQALHVRVGDVKSDLMKWSFVCWCGAVAAIAALAGVLRS
jgi:hypothetical protein